MIETDLPTIDPTTITIPTEEETDKTDPDLKTTTEDPDLVTETEDLVATTTTKTKT